jgi:hypothetical protein
MPCASLWLKHSPGIPGITEGQNFPCEMNQLFCPAGQYPFSRKGIVSFDPYRYHILSMPLPAARSSPERGFDIATGSLL